MKSCEKVVFDESYLADRFVAMNEQEAIYCKLIDYFQSQHDDGLHEAINGISRLPIVINKKCREKMVDWCYKVAEFGNFHRETVSTAVFYFDSFLSIKEGRFALYDKRQFQLVIMSSLSLAVKLNETTGIMNMNLLAMLGQGAYSIKEFSEMELKLCIALKWRMNPPISWIFADHFLELLPQTVHTSVKNTIRNLSRMQTEHATRDYFFVSYKPSIIGLASVMNAMDTVDVYFSVSATARQAFYRDIILVAGIDPSLDSSLYDVRVSLQNSVQGIIRYVELLLHN